MDQDLIKRIVEAALLAAGQPLGVAQLSALFPEEQPAPPGAIEKALHALGEEAAQRGIELVEVASGFRYQVRSEVHAWVSRLWTERPPRYSRALLETLALIAYRQPITRGEIEQIRGVAVSSNIIRTLEEREWVRVVGHRDVPGKPALYGTTRAFLDYFGLRSLDQLPPLSELREIPDLEPQLALEPVEGAPRAGAHDAEPDPDSDGEAGHGNAADGAAAGDGDVAGRMHASTDTGNGDHDTRPTDEVEDESGDVAANEAVNEAANEAADEAGILAAHAAGDETGNEHAGTPAPADADATGATDDTNDEGPTGTVRPEQTA